MVNKHLALLLQRYGLKYSYAEKKIYGGDINNEGDDKIIQGEVSINTEEVNKQDNAKNEDGSQPPKPSILSRITSSLKKKTPEQILAENIVKSIQDALNISIKKSSLLDKNTAEHDIQVKKDIEKITKFVISKKIDMNYGGGLLMFDSTFDIKNMIYMCNRDNKPMFDSLKIEPNMKNNSINTILQGSMQTYKSAKIVEEIKNKFI